MILLSTVYVREWQFNQVTVPFEVTMFVHLIHFRRASQFYTHWNPAFFCVWNAVNCDQVFGPLYHSSVTF